MSDDSTVRAPLPDEPARTIPAGPGAWIAPDAPIQGPSDRDPARPPAGVPPAAPDADAAPGSPGGPGGARAERTSSLHGVHAYWELREAPFDNSPNPKFSYLSPGHQETLARLEYAIRQRKGWAMLTGEYGSGKTMLVRALLQRLGTEGYEIGLVTNPCRDAVEFLTEILYQLGTDTPERSKPGLVRMLSDLLYRNYRAGRDTVLVIDEGQLIDDERIFEELRLLMNIQTDDRFLATVLLVGSSELRAKLGRLAHVEQRVAMRCHLEALDLVQTAGYITHRLKIAGLEQRIFTDDAIRLVFELSGGAPRKINNLCDTALLIGYNKFALEIDRKIVAESSRTALRGAEEEPSGTPPAGAGSTGGDASPADAPPREPAGPKDPWPQKYL